MSKSRTLDDQILLLKRQLHITPKTATLLIKSGYSDYTTLAAVSPEQVSKQFQETLNLPDKLAYAYKRALRRIVWLGTQEKPERFEKNCRDWSDRALKQSGAWCEGFDRLTGTEIEARIGSAGEGEPFSKDGKMPRRRQQRKQV